MLASYNVNREFHSVPTLYAVVLDQKEVIESDFKSQKALRAARFYW